MLETAHHQGMNGHPIKDSPAGSVRYPIHEYDGILFDSFTPAVKIPAAKEYVANRLREDDVFVWTYPKAGTHWAATVASLILHGPRVEKPSSMPLELIDYPRELEPAGETWQEIFQYLDAEPSPRVIFSHLPHHLFPAQLIASDTTAKVIRVVRNPKDVCTSYYHFEKKLNNFTRDVPFHEYFEWFINGRVCYGSYTTCMKNWFKEGSCPKALTLVFEEMKKDPRAAIVRVADFLGKKLSEDDLDEIVRRSSFGEMHKHVDKDFLRKGQSGDWKSQLTVAQSERIDEWIASELAGYKVPIMYD